MHAQNVSRVMGRTRFVVIGRPWLAAAVAMESSDEVIWLTTAGDSTRVSDAMTWMGLVRRSAGRPASIVQASCTTHVESLPPE